MIVAAQTGLIALFILTGAVVAGLIVGRAISEAIKRSREGQTRGPDAPREGTGEASGKKRGPRRPAEGTGEASGKKRGPGSGKNGRPGKSKTEGRRRS